MSSGRLRWASAHICTRCKGGNAVIQLSPCTQVNETGETGGDATRAPRRQDRGATCRGTAELGGSGGHGSRSHPLMGHVETVRLLGAGEGSPRKV